MKLAVAMLLSLAAVTFAQVSSLEGTVTGPDGAPLNGAVIRIERTDIKGRYQTKTAANGHFFYSGLPLGTYNVTCVVDGNDVDSLTGVRTRLGDPVPINFDLREKKPVGHTTANPTPAVSRGVTLSDAISQTRSATHYYALVIGNDDYQHTTHLKTAVSDAQQIETVLRTQYGFTTEPMLNASRDQILGALNRYRRTLPPDSALVIYYAGHGYFDRDSGRAYWLPVDAQPNENTHWISADDITADIRATPARQILVISDSCYSGALSRSIPVNMALPAGDRERFLQTLRTRGPARILLSSGGNEPVTDTGGSGLHSVFASALLRGLREMSVAQYTVEELFTGYIQEAVAGQSGQVPECSPLRNSGHDSGSFIFERMR